MPSALGARVRVEGGNYTVSDGPFTESKELVGGLAILSAPSKEAAIQYVKEFLAMVGQGECELRQLYEAPPCVHPKDAVVSSELVSAKG